MNRIILKLILFSLFWNVNIALSQDSIDIYNLNLTQLSNLKITSASKVTQKINEVPSTIYIITAAKIKENGYYTIEDALSDLPGFQFRNIQGINSYAFQRGMPNQNNLTLLLIDGIQVNELNSGGFYGGAQYNLADVERIEVIYGPSSVAYGTNAVTGIINIITKNPLTNSVELNSLAGTYNTYKSDINVSYVNEKKTLGILVSGMYKTSDKANLKGQAGDNNWTDLMDNFEIDKSFNIKTQMKDFTIGTNYINKKTTTATMFKSVGTDYKDYGTLWNIQFVNNYIKYSKKFSEKISLSSVVYNRNATVLSNSIYYVFDTAQVGYYRPNNLTGLENILNYTINKKLSITSGIILEYDKLSQKNTFSYSDSIIYKPPRPDNPVMTNNSLVTIFMEPELILMKNLYLSGGLRFDQSSIYNQVLTPRAGLIYSYKKHRIRFSYAEAFRAPKPWDYTDGIGNSALLPEKMKSFEGAMTIAIKRNFEIDIIAYKNLLESAITKEIIFNKYKWVNSGEINTNGFEVFFKYDTKKIKTSLNYTYNKSYDEFGYLIDEISKHTGNASFTYYFNDNIKINFRANYFGKRNNPKIIAATNNDIINQCVLFHGALSFLNYKGISFQVIAQNILNTEYYHPSNRDPDRYRQPQRTIMLNVSYIIDK